MDDGLLLSLVGVGWVLGLHSLLQMVDRSFEIEEGKQCEQC